MNGAADFARDLRLEVSECLDVNPDSVRFFNAIDTPLDKFHGVDAWIEVIDKKGRSIRITLDATQRTSKTQEDCRADLLIDHVPDLTLGKSFEREYLIAVERYASKIIELIKEKGYLSGSLTSPHAIPPPRRRSSSAARADL